MLCCAVVSWARTLKATVNAARDFPDYFRFTPDEERKAEAEGMWKRPSAEQAGLDAPAGGGALLVAEKARGLRLLTSVATIFQRFVPDMMREIDDLKERFNQRLG